MRMSPSATLIGAGGPTTAQLRAAVLADLWDVLGRSGNLATAVQREAAEALAAASGAAIRLHVPGRQP